MTKYAVLLLLRLSVLLPAPPDRVVRWSLLCGSCWRGVAPHLHSIIVSLGGDGGLQYGIPRVSPTGLNHVPNSFLSHEEGEVTVSELGKETAPECLEKLSHGFGPYTFSFPRGSGDMLDII